MQAAHESPEEFRERMRDNCLANIDYNRSLLKALTVTATSHNDHVAPRHVDRLHYAILKGTMDHCDVNADVERADLPVNRGRETYRNSRAFEEVIMPNETLHSDVKEGILTLTHAHPRSGTSMGGTPVGWSQVDHITKHHHVTGPLSYRFVKDINENVIPAFREAEREDITGIGTAMHQYV